MNKDKCTAKVSSLTFDHSITIKTVHNHKPDPERGECLEVLEKVKDMSIKADSNSRMIMNKAQSNLSISAAFQMNQAH